MYTFVFLGSKYKKPDRQQFLDDVEIGKAELLMRPPLKQRANQIAFLIGSSTDNYRCGTVGTVGYHAIQCQSTQKLIDDANAVSPAWNCIILYIKGEGYGSGNDRLAIIGVGSRDNSAATNAFYGGTYATRMGSITAHEVGHSAFRFADYTTGGGVMNSVCNGGACIINETYVSFMQDTINGILNSISGPYTDTMVPSIVISSPVDSATISISGGINIRATIGNSFPVIRVEVVYDGATIHSEPYWDRNVFACDANGFRVNINPMTHAGVLSTGTHTIQLRVVTAAGNTYMSTPTIINLIA